MGFLEKWLHLAWSKTLVALCLYSRELFLGEENTIAFIVQRVFTCINVFMSKMLSFYKYKNINQSPFYTVDLLYLHFRLNATFLFSELLTKVAFKVEVPVKCDSTPAVGLFMIIFHPPPLFFLYLDDEPSPNATTPVKPPRSDSQQKQLSERRPPSLSSSQSLQSSGTEAERQGGGGGVPMPFSLIAPPPRERSARAKARCSTLPPRPRGGEAHFSLARPSHSTSLGRFQQQVPLVPLLPLASLPASASSTPLAQVHTPPSPSPSPQQESATSTELFALKGPPPQPPRSRVKSRCFTLPPRQRAPDPEDHPSGPSHSSSVTQLSSRVPPSPSELKRNTPV